MPEIITRAEAKTRGLKHYFTGKPCKRGHVCERTVSCGSCCICAIEYSREFRALNPEKIRERDRKHYAQNRKRLCEYSKQYMKKWRKLNPERARNISRKRWQNEEYREKTRARNRAYYQAHRKELYEKSNKARKVRELKIRALILAMESLGIEI